ncbi:MAG TPA: hypothetical protein VHO72_17320 [Bacteroidales bacterium]|nr:hypothetical protein [Bacteroidales bacterium]
MKKFTYYISLILSLCAMNTGFSQKLQFSPDTIVIDSSNYTRYLNLSKKLLNRYQLTQAGVIAEKLYAYDTLNTDGILQCADVYSDLNNADKTIFYYTKAIEADTMNIYPYLKAGEFFQKNNRFVEALNTYAPVVNSLDTMNYFALKQSGICVLLLGNPMLFQMALRYLDRAAAVNPYDLSLYFRIANTCNTMRDFDRSIAVCQKGLAIDSTNTVIRTAMAYAQYHKSDFKNAIENFEKVKTQGDSSSFVVKNLGYAYYRDNQFEPARKHLTRAAKMLYNEGVNEYDVYFFLGDVCVQLNDPKAALSFLQKADSLRYPSSEVQSKIYKSFATVYNSERDWANGAKFFEMAYNTNPEDKGSLLLWAYQCDYMKDKNKAFELYTQFLNSEESKDYPKELAIVKQRITKLKEDLFFEGKAHKK